MFEREPEDTRIRVGDAVLFQPLTRVYLVFDSHPDTEMRIAVSTKSLWARYTHVSGLGALDPEPVTPDIFYTRVEFVKTIIEAGRRLLGRGTTSTRERGADAPPASGMGNALRLQQRTTAVQ
jgi:hypothetical protein